jgi:flagellar biosynthesis/type III secretory pathway M-ring protein FliF/YscJ
VLADGYYLVLVVVLLVLVLAVAAKRKEPQRATGEEQSNQGTKRTQGNPNGPMDDRAESPRQQGKAEDSEAAESETPTGRLNAQGPGERRSGSPEEKGPALKVKRRSGTKEGGGGGRGDVPPRV